MNEMNAIHTSKLASDIITEAEEKISRLKQIEIIIDLICEYFEVSRRSFTSKSRKGEIVDARKMFAAICKHRYGERITLKTIGRHMGHRDHSTVLNLLKRHKEHMDGERGWRVDFKEVRNLIEERLKPVKEK